MENMILTNVNFMDFIKFIIFTSLVFVFCIFTLYTFIENILLKIKIKVQVKALLPLVLGVPFWLHLAKPLFVVFYGVLDIPKSIDIFLGVLIGLVSTSFYEIIISTLIKLLKNYIYYIEVKKQ